ncbi:alpha-galactosidase [Jiangella alba]|uniref:alpha-galactosidase n=1 Tax=Jiangella alba TaxID=561176 RepID=UPI001C0E64F8|nr:alpha-galactosidase [Jiangella alba]
MLNTHEDGRLPHLAWLGTAADGVPAEDVVALAAPNETPLTSWDAWLVEGAPSICPTQADGHLGRPALLGFRVGQPGGATPSFTDTIVDTDERAVVVRARDVMAGLELGYVVEALPGGSLRIRTSLTNLGRSDYVLDSLDVVVPLPVDAREALDLTGRWAKEKQPQRHRIADGLWVREHRRGMRALDTTPVLAAGSAGFGFRDGRVIGIHLAWSGNHRYALERVSSGTTLLRAGELLAPGEVCLVPGDSYETPWVHVAASTQGLDGLAAAFHDHVRSQPSRPARQLVTYNAWEAVYLDHDPSVLGDLARSAAAVGAERFVLDDGWFKGRNSLQRGVGDWTPDPVAWPDGLRPLADQVHALGMEFGLWWEPEAINLDSDLYRAHPEWALVAAGRIPPVERATLVLDLSRDDVRDHLTKSFAEIVAQCPVDFVKWDLNRDLVDAALDGGLGSAAGRAQTLGFYRLLDELIDRFPGISWESCASGGGRSDLAVLERVQSVWTSDNTDPVSRQTIQQWSAQLVPLEYLASHVAPSPSHQTGRASSLELRAATAFMGAFGIQLNLNEASDEERAQLTAWTSLYKRHRSLLHSGRLIRLDLGPGVTVSGVVAQDGSQAILSYAQLEDLAHVPPRLQVPGLLPESAYVATRLLPPGLATEVDWDIDGFAATGAGFAAVGLPGPARRPLSAALVHLRERSGDTTRE